MRRSLLAVVGAVAGVALLSGCGAEILPLAAVHRDSDGHLKALLRPCGDDRIYGLGLRATPTDEEAADADPERNFSGWEAHGQRTLTDADFPLFSPPAAWRSRPVGAQELTEEYTYTLGFGKDGEPYYSGLVKFRAADIERLRPGRVWADDRAMTLGEFEELAEDSC